MKNQKRKIIKKIIFITLALTAFFIAVKFWAQQSQSCFEYYVNYTESFTNNNRKDIANTSVANWPPSPIQLPRLGANFAIVAPAGMGARIYVCDSGDFDGDGDPDLVGLDILGQFQSLPYRSRLMLVRNNNTVLTVDATKVFDSFSTVSTGPASITVGDYNGDGLLDFFFMRNTNDEFGYTNFLAAMYINVGTRTDPVFRAFNVSPNLDFTSRFQTARIYINWAANHLCSVDIDQDGDIDILVISEDKIFLLTNPGASRFSLANFGISELRYNNRTGFTGNRGGSAVAAADFDKDGDIDIIAGTVNDFNYLAYYENDGTGFFTRRQLVIPDSRCKGTVGIVAADLTNNGWPDIFVATDRWNITNNQARMWMFRNFGLRPDRTINWTFQCLNNCNPILPPDYDTDIVCSLDYDLDGDLDIILADANHSGDYYLVVNELANVFSLSGQAQSLNISEGTINSTVHAITKVRISSLNMSVNRDPTGLRVKFFLSNNNGRDWEEYTELNLPDNAFIGANIRNYSSPLPWHEFKTFGGQLKWKAVLSAPEDSMADYQGASFDTPRIHNVSFEYIYVDRKEYSRASATTTILTGGGQEKKLLIGSSFIFPGFQGQLRAYDLTAMAPSSVNYSTLTTITTSNLASPTGRNLNQGVTIFWDAGQLLADRSPDSRTIYTAIRSGGNIINPLTRIEFHRNNASTLAQFLGDFQNDPAGLIDFVRGAGRDWKLGSINHSSPVIVGPPDENPTLMGEGYAEFRTQYAQRKKVIYVGANDGMLHCFDVDTGNELWAFIPYNLLPKLKNMWPVDAGTGRRYESYDIFVDSTPSVADVEIAGQWRTVLICGQGPGRGSAMASSFPNIAGGVNYYFALDVTDPDNPRPLWEFTNFEDTFPTVGESWSVPAIGRVRLGAGDRWVAFFGSGYNNLGNAYAGRYFYAVRVGTGLLLQKYEVTNVNTTTLGTRPFPDIPVAIPASPSAIDKDRDGYLDSVYFADLDGRVWRLNVTETQANNWTVTKIYEDRLNYPIISMPLAWLNPVSTSTTPKIFFGTGGDDRSPSDRTYSFVCLTDTGTANPPVEWFIGDSRETGLPAGKAVGAFDVGERVWADPVIADFIVYFSTLKGSIEGTNPCVNLGDWGKLYGRYIQNVAGIPVGGTAFRSERGTPAESLQLVSKARQAVTLGEVDRSGGQNKREVFIQEYDSTIEMLAQPIGSILRIKSWREVYKIVR